MKTIMPVVMMMLVALLACGCAKKPQNIGPVVDAPATQLDATVPLENDAPLPPVTDQAIAPREPAYESPPATGQDTYVVQKGDTFFAISRKLYGDNTHAKLIMALNPGVEPTKLQPGQILKVPPK